jgi:hypothetical protein
MTRDAVTVSTVAFNTALASPAGTTVNAANDIIITPTVPVSELLIRVTHTAAAEYDLTIVAGANPPAFQNGQGDLVVPFAAGNVTPVIKFFTVESARFQQVDGSIHLDFETGFTGAVAAFALPAGA